mmetsp:Transcript_32525/g.103721  ORF Transcript_32525/g.103721 Transcript_32525/m.103721 type:complete len:533 (+) Transcript_32525:248-1846(+)
MVCWTHSRQKTWKQRVRTVVFSRSPQTRQVIFARSSRFIILTASSPPGGPGPTGPPEPGPPEPGAPAPEEALWVDEDRGSFLFSRALSSLPLTSRTFLSASAALVSASARASAKSACAMASFLLLSSRSVRARSASASAASRSAARVSIRPASSLRRRSAARSCFVTSETCLSFFSTSFFMPSLTKSKREIFSSSSRHLRSVAEESARDDRASSAAAPHARSTLPSCSRSLSRVVAEASTSSANDAFTALSRATSSSSFLSDKEGGTACSSDEGTWCFVSATSSARSLALTRSSSKLASSKVRRHVSLSSVVTGGSSLRDDDDAAQARSVASLTLPSQRRWALASSSSRFCSHAEARASHSPAYASRVSTRAARLRTFGSSLGSLGGGGGRTGLFACHLMSAHIALSAAQAADDASRADDEDEKEGTDDEEVHCVVIASSGGKTEVVSSLGSKLRSRSPSSRSLRHFSSCAASRSLFALSNASSSPPPPPLRASWVAKRASAASRQRSASCRSRFMVCNDCQRLRFCALTKA